MSEYDYISTCESCGNRNECVHYAIGGWCTGYIQELEINTSDSTKQPADKFCPYCGKALNEKKEQ